MPALSFTEMYQRLMAYPNICKILTFDLFLKFVRLSATVKCSIMHSMKPTESSGTAPASLPRFVLDFLSSALKPQGAEVQGL
ncbi:hypothetical protein FA15DRAFT_672090 [Coprinopsis marcescibilis]|uniref:Uncharacterized protein n=1 Tax=Coprinopsis marcescibilis TaxID=230819 RepID=A0A5C3L114_COPMA|nr:hypothetical protein FA15DRAFT_672090 [Coprinopsis marcescibilis]